MRNKSNAYIMFKHLQMGVPNLLGGGGGGGGALAEKIPCFFHVSIQYQVLVLNRFLVAVLSFYSTEKLTACTGNP